MIKAKRTTLRHLKNERKRLHFKSKRHIIFLKVKNNKDLFTFSDSFHDKYLFCSILQVILRNPYISEKYCDKMYFLKGSSSKAIKNLAYLVDKLFTYVDSSSNNSEYSRTDSINSIAQNIFNSSNIAELLKSISECSTIKEVNKSFKLKFLSHKRELEFNSNSEYIDSKQIHNNRTNYFNNFNSNSLSNSNESTNLGLPLPSLINNSNSIDSNKYSNRELEKKDSSINNTLSVHNEKDIESYSLIKLIYKKLINTLVEVYCCKGTYTLKTSELDKFIKTQLKKRKNRVFENVFTGLDAEIFSCKNCNTSKISFRPYVLNSCSNNNSFKSQIENKYFDTILEDYFCTKCDLPTYYKVVHKKIPLVYPKIIAFVVNNKKVDSFYNELDNSFLLRDSESKAFVYKLFSCIKKTNAKNGINYMTQIKYEDNSIFEFRPENAFLMYVSEVFQLNKDNQYEMFFYYDTNLKINF